MKLSVAIAVYNEEKNLKKCLESVCDIASEIILVDGGSVDKTIEIAETFSAKIIKSKNYPIFHRNKQKALDNSKGRWILQMDADEVITDKLREEIARIVANNDKEFDGYNIPRRNNFWGHFMKKGGQYPDYVIRLVRNGKAHFPCKSVHEQIVVDGKVGYLENPMLHYTYRTMSEYFRKSSAYVDLTSNELKRDQVKINIKNVLYYFVTKPISTFMSIFIRHKGFVDGIYGFVFAILSALHHPLAFGKYIKRLR